MIYLYFEIYLIQLLNKAVIIPNLLKNKIKKNVKIIVLKSDVKYLDSKYQDFKRHIL